MPSEIERLETNIKSLLQSVPYLLSANGGQILGATDVKPLLQFSSLGAPSAVVVFNGEVAKPPATIGKDAVQETELEWAIYLIASSFSIDGDGRAGAVGAYQMVDDTIAALEGQVISIDPPGRLYYGRARRYDVDANTVTYEVTMRHRFLRVAG